MTAKLTPKQEALEAHEGRMAALTAPPELDLEIKDDTIVLILRVQKTRFDNYTLAQAKAVQRAYPDVSPIDLCELIWRDLFYARKLAALRQVWGHLALARVLPPSLDEEGRAAVIERTRSALRTPKLPSQRGAMRFLLDIQCPGWEAEEPELFGVFAERDDPEIRKWRGAVLERDEFVCRSCGGTSELHAHHIVRWVDSPELRADIDNGVTLCRGCHQKAHSAEGVTWR